MRSTTYSTLTELLAGSSDNFVFGREVYYRVYAERSHVVLSRERSELLLATAFRGIYAPFLFWLAAAEPQLAAREILRSIEAPKQPIVLAAFTAITLMGPEPVAWLREMLEKKYGSHSQKPEYYWTFRKISNRSWGVGSATPGDAHDRGGNFSNSRTQQRCESANCLTILSGRRTCSHNSALTSLRARVGLKLGRWLDAWIWRHTDPRFRRRPS